MHFDKLTLTNFMSIRKAEIELAGQGLLLVQGKNLDDTAFDSNGAGKSSVFEGLVNVLFDRTVRGLKGDDVIHEDIGKNCSQILDLKDNNNVPFRIARYRKHNEHKNNVYVYRDGKNITPKSAKDTNAFIETLIGMDYDTFVNSILFGQGLIKMFTVASDAEKKSILEKMLQMTVLQDAQDKAKEKAKEENAKADKLQRELEQNYLFMEETEHRISQLQEREKEHATNTKSEVERLLELIDGIETKLVKETANFVDDEEKVEELTEKKKAVEKKLERFKQYEEARNELSLDLRVLLRDKQNYEDHAERLKKEIEKIKAGEGTNCIACGQVITPDTIEQSLQHTVSNLRETLTVKKQVFDKLIEKKADLEKLDKFLEGKKPLETEKSVIIGELSDLNASIKSRDRILESLESQKTEYHNRITRVEAEAEKTYKPLIEDMEGNLEELKAKEIELEESKKVVLKKARLYEFWVKGFGNSGIKSYLLDSVTPFLNKKANYYLGKLAGNTTEIKFTTKTKLKSGEEREKFDVQILNKVGGGAYVKNSTGERRRIDLAISLALQDLVMSRSNGKFNILLYDEIFDGLDAVGCENAIQLLQEVQESVESIFVITHNDVLKAYFDKQLTVTKENGQTTVKKEG